MTLTDNEVLEVQQLTSALADERITAAQQRRLGDFLKSSEEARTIYFHSISLSASLAEYAGEMQCDAPTEKIHQVNFRAWTLTALAAAACVAIGLSVVYLRPETPLAVDELAESEMPAGALVARLTGAKDCVWRGATKFQPGDEMKRGQRVDLAEGIAEITFDSGALVKLEGPAVLDVVSAWEATLQSGGLKATETQQAIGFRVHHKSVEVVDLGTEFSMVAEAGGEAEVHVLKGAVEVSPVNEEENAPSVLRENETRRFGKSLKTKKSDFSSQHSRLAKTAPLDRWNHPVNFAHWSFDEVKDGAFHSESSGLSGVSDITPANPALIEGRWGQALHFNGHNAISTAAPGISNPASRAVAFWVRLSEDTKLSDSQAIVVWTMRSKKFGSQTLQIGWNRNPNHGPLGALRTELGKINAVGATSLRDGKWHHIAVSFFPIGTGGEPLQVTQYVDGHLEGTTVRY
ncbi:MAG: FecR domain-containing protein, partial [Verrucomicrobia bacterium]|nr:FecR domain-containing protein [Verrucomicrobiota bacterium]